jgi:hypothetical protein
VEGEVEEAAEVGVHERLGSPAPQEDTVIGLVPTSVTARDSLSTIATTADMGAGTLGVAALEATEAMVEAEVVEVVMVVMEAARWVIGGAGAVDIAVVEVEEGTTDTIAGYLSEALQEEAHRGEAVVEAIMPLAGTAEMEVEDMVDTVDEDDKYSGFKDKIFAFLGSLSLFNCRIHCLRMLLCLWLLNTPV